jgi:hypothetical protein
VNCPGCGKDTNETHECTYRHAKSSVIIRLTQGPIASVGPSFASYKLRVVETLPDFVETIRIFDAGLNDAIVAVCKLHVLANHRAPTDHAHLRFVTIDDEGLLRFTAVAPELADYGQYVTVTRAEYVNLCRTLHHLIERTEKKGEWLKVDAAFLLPFLGG